MTTPNILQSELLRLGVPFSEAHLEVLSSYIRELEHWSQSMNLTGLAGAELIRRLVAEPLWVADQLRPEGRYVDIGSGNGSPAIPWHVVRSFTGVVLVESRQRRSTFLQRLSKRLELENVTVRRGRFEDVCPELGPADWVTLQGVALTAKMIENIHQSNGDSAKIVWLTRTTKLPDRPILHLDIPNSDRQALVF